MRKALVFGAGNIGRGFLGVLLCAAGYEITFADVDGEKITLLNRRREYPVFVCSKQGVSEQIVRGVRGVNARDVESVQSEVCNSDLILTAVGKNALHGVATALAGGLIERARCRPGSNLAIIVIACENVQDNTAYLHQELMAQVPVEYRSRINEVSFPNCVVDRIVPSVLPHGMDGIPLAVAVEDYYQFVVDATQLKTEFPAIPGIEVVLGVSAKLEQKLFTLNMAHGVLGYYGVLKGYEFVQEAVSDEDILALTRGALREVEEVVVRRHASITRADQQAYAERTLERFANPFLRDSLMRVASQPKRKLAYDERLVRPARLLWRLGRIPAHLATGIASAFRFKNERDLQSVQMQTDIEAHGIDAVLHQVAGLSPKHNLAQLVRADFLMGALAN